MNPLRQDDPRHKRALNAARGPFAPSGDIIAKSIDAYFTALNEQGVVLVEAYAGDDAGR